MFRFIFIDNEHIHIYIYIYISMSRMTNNDYDFLLDTMFIVHINRTAIKCMNELILSHQRYRTSSTILSDYANVYRPEVESELEYLAVQTSKEKSLQVNYELE
jgi:hypothetical protein